MFKHIQMIQNDLTFSFPEIQGYPDVFLIQILEKKDRVKSFQEIPFRDSHRGLSVLASLVTI